MSQYKGPQSAFDPAYIPMLIEHMGKGFSYESFSAKIGTCRQTLYNWEKEFPEWLDTKKKAMEVCQYWWEAAGVEGLYTIYGKNEDGKREVIEKSINPSLWIFNMKARFRWKDQDPKPQEQLQEREALTIEDKKKLLVEARKEIQTLEAEIINSEGNREIEKSRDT